MIVCYSKIVKQSLVSFPAKKSLPKTFKRATVQIVSPFQTLESGFKDSVELCDSGYLAPQDLSFLPRYHNVLISGKWCLFQSAPDHS